ncbi:lipase [Lyngbya sp. CCY1209]|uniref:lipase family protein n=1 Tax=Lyngbya sp. CCY1209 TaxID=2886103 RepID=UPI002D2127B9|nr:lipase [Lyngbya sp. CCY1209]MEB3883190.1 lipase [Lyngbya sp. CCY1209]
MRPKSLSLSSILIAGIFLFYPAISSRSQEIGAVPAIQSPEFEAICRSGPTADCETIGKAAHLTTDLIYELFDGEITHNRAKYQSIIGAIAQLYGTEPNAVQVVNKRLKLSDFFIVEADQVFGGYAVFIRPQNSESQGRQKAKFFIAFKGVYPKLEDPNDIAAALSALPEHLYRDAGVLIHRGFRDYAASVFQDETSQTAIADILRLQADPQTDVEVLVTGHSLGGCAILYAALLVDAGVSPQNIQAIVFGSGPVATSDFITQYPDLIPNITRVETGGDMLIYEDGSPMKPIYDTLGYVPFGKLIHAPASDRLNQLKQQLLILEQRRQTSPSENLTSDALNLAREILQERVAIHTHSYRYYYQRYRSGQGDRPLW